MGLEPPRCRFTGWNGKDWKFGDPSCPLRLAGVKGLAGAPTEFVDVQGAGQLGVTNVDITYGPNVVTLDVNVGPLLDDEPVMGDQAVAIFSAWRRSLGIGKQVGKFELVETGRFQMVRAVMSTMPDYSIHQVFNAGWTREQIQLRSDESCWRTDPFDQTFPYGSTIEVDNLGDFETWPWYEIIGPITNPTVGLMGETRTIKKADGSNLVIPAGQKLTIQTDPDLWEIVDHTGTDQSWIGDRWHQRAPETTVGIPVTFTGSGTSSGTSIRVVIPQLYWQAI
ncbi:hypothetical protein [Gordonia sp. OPL2]|uniref:hypothetical protein n=1 Tax=Gordonia sp. OPL2 TaxID=2486274 RepID=UPI0016562000|nr:hypothetical protein [Gordonia sp. OPL2]ROZ89016.1 hypothetical protein EEB19_20115 [Gordonia sp. OPL2]